MASPRLLRLAALVAVAAPAVGLALVLFVGATISNCHATVGDGTPRPACPVQVVVSPPIRTEVGTSLSAAVALASGLFANGLLLAHLFRFDRPRLMRLGAAIILIAASAAGVGFLTGLTQRLRYAVEGGVGWAIGGLVLGWFVAVVWVGLRPASDGRSSFQLSSRGTS